jgi:hypothetical protein
MLEIAESERLKPKSERKGVEWSCIFYYLRFKEGTIKPILYSELSNCSED